MNRPVRILHVITGLGIGGAESVLARLVVNTSSHFDNTVLSLAGDGPVAARIQDAGVKLIFGNLRPSFSSPFAMARLFRPLREAKPDLIMGWMYHGAFAATVFGKVLPGKPVIAWNIRQTVLPAKAVKRSTHAMFRLLRMMAHTPRAIVYNSGISVEQHETLGFPLNRRWLIPNGIDTELFKPDAVVRAHVRRQLGLQPDSFLIGLLARYHPMKDHAGFLRALAIVVKAHPQVRGLLAGTGIDTENHELTRLLRELGLETKVFLMGELNLSRMAEMQQSLDLYVSSSIHEGLSNSIQEAMACGVPAVATRVGDAPSLIGQTGLIVSPGDPAALAAAIISIIQLENGQRHQLAAGARQRILEHYSLSAMVQNYEHLYRKMLNPVPLA